MTDRRSLSDSPEAAGKFLLEKIERAAKAGVDWIQIREKDLSGKALAEFAGAALRRVAGASTILINDRLDVACAVKAGGVHLGEHSLPVNEAKRLVNEGRAGRDFLVGVSVHSLEAALAAEEAGASYVIFGPVFTTPSKADLGKPQGVGRLQAVCERLKIPVLAIGGITLGNAPDCMKAGASGIAAIRLFQEAKDLRAVVSGLRVEK